MPHQHAMLFPEGEHGSSRGNFTYLCGGGANDNGGSWVLRRGFGWIDIRAYHTTRQPHLWVG
nr:MAG TPA: hypothetical protein [Caudoviricetes sp.]